MDTQKLGFMLGQVVIGARDKRLPDISKIVGKVDGDTSKEYLALLAWTATWTVSRTLGQYAEPTLDAMHALLYYAEMIDKTKFETFIHDRYAGYYAARDDKSGEWGEGKPLYHVAKYFLACCRSSGGTVKYEYLIPDLKELEEMTEMGIVRPDVVPIIKAEIEKDVNSMAGRIRDVFDQVKNISDGDVARKQFTDMMLTELKKVKRTNLTVDAGHAGLAQETINSVGDTLLNLRHDPEVFHRELMAAARAWVEPRTYSLDISKTMEVTLYFGSFMKDVESLVLDFVKKL